ncbi:MAG: bifunctional aspartate kinase/homoserine dehydrogenase I [Acidobacteria bacterium]|nr:bifunctional aspartate kinase/homoserine dehydrogenase I [Acidobacteriota bacterium]
MKILKFGGSSLASPNRIKAVGRIVLNEADTHPLVVVVSAFEGVTNQLLACARLADGGDPAYERLYEEIARRHRAALDHLVGGRRNRRTRAAIDRLLGELREILHGISLLRYAPARALDMTASFGERLSAPIVAAMLDRSRPARSADARQFIVTDDRFTRANVIFGKTNQATRAYFKRASGTRRPDRPIPIVTGFIGATEDGRTTTIGRDGSDYTAAIVGAALGASAIEIWTDVDGVLSADPRAVPAAFVLPHMTYEEAMEMSYFGAKVLHPAAIAPAVAKGIPIHIKNTLNPAAPGTLISRSQGDWDGVAKGITSVDDITLLTLRGLAMVGVPGTAERLFRTLAARRVNVILISQASSEHTICFAVSRADAAEATRAVQAEFRFELQHSLTTLEQRPDQSIVAVVGERMKGTPGVSGKVFGSLGRHNINVSAIAQGASERNISCVIDSAQQVRALNVIHQAFFEKCKRLALVVVGVGNIGGALLRQLHQQRGYLLERGFDVRAVAVANSKRFMVAADGLNLARWREALAEAPHRMNPEALVRAIASLGLTNAALVDCTAADAVVDAYPDFINAGLHIITPNKRANVLPWRRYANLMDLVRTRQKHLLCEANVGAGLPVLSTLNDLMASGDVIVKVEGILSGTLSYLFNTFDGTRPFSALVRDAHRLGFTEPDPRRDLSGEDVARKLLILARQMGLQMDITDVRAESLIPRRLRTGPFSDRFFSAFARSDAEMAGRFARARAGHRVLRYTGRLEKGKAVAGLEEYRADHPFAATKGSDNVIAFTTNRYAHTPLVVQGPGAGADVTAMGVFSDILKLLYYLPR